MKTKVAFVCVHNSCRSQIAEALAKKNGSDLIGAYSAGTQIKDKINDDAVRLMKQLYEIDLEETQKPKLVSEIPNVDYLITMGCQVICPILPYKYKKIDWELDDPTGKEDAEFKRVIKEIELKVLDLIEDVKREENK